MLWGGPRTQQRQPEGGLPRPGRPDRQQQLGNTHALTEAARGGEPAEVERHTRAMLNTVRSEPGPATF